jgi:hypothetical protein
VVNEMNVIVSFEVRCEAETLRLVEFFLLYRGFDPGIGSFMWCRFGVMHRSSEYWE